MLKPDTVESQRVERLYRYRPLRARFRRQAQNLFEVLQRNLGLPIHVDRVAQFLVDVTRKRPGAWWRDDFTLRFAFVNGLPGVVVDAPEGPVQTTAFEIEGDVIKALYVVRNPDKLRHLAPARRERGPE